MLSSETFQNFLSSVREISGAETVSLFINDGPREDSDPLLLHEGKINPLPEMDTPQSTVKAVTFLNNRAIEQNKANSVLIGFEPNPDGNARILRLHIGKYIQTLKENQNLPSETDRRISNSSKSILDDNAIIWIGLTFGSKSIPEWLDFSTELRVIHENEVFLAFRHLLCMGGTLVWKLFLTSDLFRNRVGHLPGRSEFQFCLKKVITEARLSEFPVGLVLLNPDEFATINQRLGRDKGDQTLAELVDRLVVHLRRTDLVFRYGGAMFAIVLPNSSERASFAIAEKIRTGLTGRYLNGLAHLSFSVSAAILEKPHGVNVRQDAVTLVNQAEQALNLAKLSGGGRTVIWDKSISGSSNLTADRLSNIFTSDSEKDYRNMLLLWDTIAVISMGTEAQTIAKEFVERIKNTLKPFSIGLFPAQKDSDLQSLAVSYGQDYNLEIPKQEQVFAQKQKELMERVKQGGRTERIRFSVSEKTNNGEIDFVAYAFPLIAREQLIGLMYIDGPSTSFVLDSSDLIFLNALTRQMGAALDRAALALRWKQEKEAESRRLRQEVRELRQVVHSAKLVYRSSQMQSLLDTLSSVASTDVTILITGESGTGKEMLARAIHEQSPRNNKPLITVDCGAIAHSLIEAELFGHVKGAYTGAQTGSQGRIQQAQGGTLLLDEIGELPLDVQSKLLRFVQEKEITPVGGSYTKQVDVRIVAATNRDLVEEVAKGRFRGDLYYRLQVITLKAPPLRERPDDILPLVRHFLEKFAIQYQKRILRLNTDAEKALLAYQWPGNIRELQNTIMRAVVISKTDCIDLVELQLNPAGLSQPVLANRNEERPVLKTPEHVNSAIGGVTLTAASSSAGQNPLHVGKDYWQTLRHYFEKQIRTVLEADQVIAVPLGRWLNEDLVLAADRIESGVSRRASARLGLAETTFRRQFEKVKRAKKAGVLTRTESWKEIEPFLDEVVRFSDGVPVNNMVDYARKILLQEVIKLVPRNRSLGAALMGVSLPTLQRWLETVGD